MLFYTFFFSLKKEEKLKASNILLAKFMLIHAFLLIRKNGHIYLIMYYTTSEVHISSKR